MKRGRPSIRGVVQTNLMDVLQASQTPLTVSAITRMVAKGVNRQVSWNTVQKYLSELIELEKVQAIILPHSKLEDKTGLTVYILKR